MTVSQQLFQQAAFIMSAPRGAPMPPDRGYEVAFVGRSNSGKSSSINTLTGRRGLARTSRTPGRTQLVNFFDLGEDRRLADLPGYGYARVPEAMRRDWGPMIEQYLRERESLAGLIVTVDVRRDPGEFEDLMLVWCRESAMPVHLLLTKSDKLRRGAAHAALHGWEKRLRELPELDASVQLFSSLDRTGVDEARGVLARWLNFGQKKAPA